MIRTRENPLVERDGLAVLRGNLAPDGAVIKPAGDGSRILLRHTGPAVVFRDYNDMAARIDDPALEVTKDSVLVLQSAGPQGAPGLPEWGQLPIPKKLLQQGVRDMVRISDARMSGTSYGACVLHVAPESHVGGPLAFVQRRRPDRARRARPHADAQGRRRGARAPARGMEGARSRITRAASARCISSTSRRPTKAATSTSSRRRRSDEDHRSRDPLNIALERNP